MMRAHEDWRSLEVGKEYPLALKFDTESPWRGTFTAVKFGNLVLLMNSFAKGKFPVDIGVKLPSRYILATGWSPR